MHKTNYYFRVPQVLLYFGVLEYSEKLKETLKQGKKCFMYSVIGKLSILN
jgi:hypothetical protein